MPSEALLVAPVDEARLFAINGDLYRIGAVRVERYDLVQASPPALEASGSPAGLTFVDLESTGGSLFVAVRGQGVREVLESLGVITLGAAPSPAHSAAALFAIPESGGERLWRAAGLAGAAEINTTKRVLTSCELRDADVSPADLLLVTGCGLEREVFP
jgi:hypothetical protein